jgi:hypothetical protein
VTARPWRAAAYWPWSYRVYVANAAAKTRAGLDRFVEEHRTAGRVVDVWQVLPLPGVTQGTQVADSPTG